MPFQYEKLDQAKKEIRLLILEDTPSSESSKKTPHTQLRCKLVAVSLDLYTRYQSPIGGDGNTIWQSIGRVLTSKTKFPEPYYALSYVWGDPSPVCEIVINGQETKISQNLGDALLSIRENSKFRVIWADALCINQTDKEEKSWQVQQMAYLYARAKTVISWLGPSFDDSTQALMELEALAISLKDSGWKQNWSKEITSASRKVEKIALELSTDTGRWKAIVALSNRSYWTRVWIFQEIACARENVFICGNVLAQDIKYPLFFLSWWARRTEKFSGSPLSFQCDSMIRTLYRYEHTLLGEALFRYRPPRLATLLIGLGILDATDSRDRVFAMLSMAEDGRWSGVVPDYSKSEVTVLIETACALLRLNWVDEIISCAITSERYSGLPSWVPNWAARHESGFIAKHFNTCKGKEQQKGILKSIPTYGLHIALHGYVVGSISRLTPSFWDFAFERDGAAVHANVSILPWLKFLEETISREPSDSQGQETIANDTTLRDKIRDRLTQMTIGDSAEHSKIGREGTEPAWFYATPEISQLSRVWPWYKRSLASGPEANTKPDHGTNRHETRFFYNGPVFYTSSGDLGITSNKSCQIGDLVVLVKGKRTPCVLRLLPKRSEQFNCEHRDGTYCLVAEAYVQGIMNGEFFHRKGQVKYQKFVLA